MAKAKFDRSKPHVNIGTIGHVDHGKTTTTAAISAHLAGKHGNEKVDFANIDKAPEEKEKLVLEYFDSKVGYRKFAESNDIYPSTFTKWIKIYRENGIEGLKSKTGKTGIGKGNFKKTEVKK